METVPRRKPQFIPTQKGMNKLYSRIYWNGWGSTRRCGVVWYDDTMLDGMVGREVANMVHLETFVILLVVPNSSTLDKM